MAEGRELTCPHGRADYPFGHTSKCHECVADEDRRSAATDREQALVIHTPCNGKTLRECRLNRDHDGPCLPPEPEREQTCGQSAPNASGEVCAKQPHPSTEQHESENYLWPVRPWVSSTTKEHS